MRFGLRPGLGTAALIGLAVAVFLATAALHTPAALVAARLRGSGIVLYGAEGTLAAGECAGVATSSGSAPQLTDLRWRLQPAWLLLGRLSFKLQSSGVMPIDGVVQWSPGSLRLRDAAIDANSGALFALGRIPFLPLTARIHLNISRLTAKNGKLVAANGHVDIRNLSWSLGREPIVLGDFSGDVSSDGDTIKLTPQSGSVLDVAGGGELQTADQHYQLDLSIHPKPNAPENLRPLLQSVGQPDAQGFYHLRDAGQLGASAAKPSTDDDSNDDDDSQPADSP